MASEEANRSLPAGPANLTAGQAASTLAILTAIVGFILAGQTAYNILASQRPVTTTHPQNVLLLPAIRSAASDLVQCASQQKGAASCRSEFSRLAKMLDQTPVYKFYFHVPGFLEAFVTGDILLLRRKPCFQSDIAGLLIAWSAWPYSINQTLTDDQIKYGVYGGYAETDKAGRRFGDTCLLPVILPTSDLKRLFVSLLDGDRKTQVWFLDQRW